MSLYVFLLPAWYIRSVRLIRTLICQWIIQTVPNSCVLILFYKRWAGGCWFEFGRFQMLFFYSLQQFHLRNSCMSSDCLWCAWTTDMGCKEKPTLSDILWLLPFISGNIFFFLPPELIGAVTECLFLYCNPIELFDIFLPAVSDTWLQQDLIWCEFGLLSFSQTSLFAILCRHPCTNLICETANIICICYPWLLS